MMQIKKLSEIDYTKGDIISFNATVLSILSDGDGEKKPFKAVLRLEDSGENVQVQSWKFDNLPILKDLIQSDEVYRFEGSAGTFGNYGNQIRIGNIQTTGIHSTKKVIKTVDIDKVKQEITALYNQYVKGRSKTLDLYCQKLIFENNDYWEWPSAKANHHNYLHGNAIHSLGVCKAAISMALQYGIESVSLPLVVTGALLHDIGKVNGEYTISGERTIYGSLIPHSLIGYEKVISVAIRNGIDPEKDTHTIMLSHIILSHHGELEKQAAVCPGIIEAFIVSQADYVDFEMEVLDKTMGTLNRNEMGEPIRALEGKKLFRWS